jgi:hypothetical protein
MNLSADLFECSDARFIRLCLPISEIIPLLEKARLFVNHRNLFTHRDIVTWERMKDKQAPQSCFIEPQEIVGKFDRM